MIFGFVRIVQPCFGVQPSLLPVVYQTLRFRQHFTVSKGLFVNHSEILGVLHKPFSLRYQLVCEI